MYSHPPLFYKNIEIDGEKVRKPFNFKEAWMLHLLLSDKKLCEARLIMRLTESDSKALSGQLQEKFGVRTLHGLTHKATLHNFHKTLPKYMDGARYTSRPVASTV